MDAWRIPATDEELLGECDVETFCSSGPGGQNVNRRETAVRLRHRPSGTVVTCQRERRQARNKQIALEWLRAKLVKTLAAQRRRRRLRTSAPRAVREKILADKRQRARVKVLRRPPSLDE